MPTRKRPAAAVEGTSTEPDSIDAGGISQTDTPLLQRVRNMWQFSNLCQWIYIFGRAAKIDDAIDIDEIEAACLKPDATLLADLALAILKLISSHRGLTHDILSDQLRKQYLAKAPGKNPFGDADAPRSFTNLDVMDKIVVLQQLTQWAMIYAERIREKMDEQKDTEQTSWRIEPYGWDRQDRTYFVLDDNRIYRSTEPPTAVAQAQPKAKKSKDKSARKGRRSSQRAGTARNGDATAHEEQSNGAETWDNGLGGQTWECIAVTLQDVRDLLCRLEKTRDQNEKVLRRQLETHLVPILEKQEEAQKRKQLQKQRELLSLEKMANAKRSSRIAGRAERQKQEDKAREDEQMRIDAERARRREEQQRAMMEKERDFRMFSRQRRLQEREARRLQHKEELAQLSEDSRRASSGTGRVSERRLQAELDKNKQALLELEQEEEDWVFDCACGLYGKVDDGQHSVACERCNVWQHSKCLGISQQEADGPNFSFVCSSCKRRDEADKSWPRPVIKLKVNSGAGTEMRSRSSPSQVSPVHDSSSTAQTQQNTIEADATITVATWPNNGPGPDGKPLLGGAGAMPAEDAAVRRSVEVNYVGNGHAGPTTAPSGGPVCPEPQGNAHGSSVKAQEATSLQATSESRRESLGCKIEQDSIPNGHGTGAITETGSS